MARILVVDDDVQIRRLFRLTLESAGHEVEEASDGAACLMRLPEVRPDMVITDIMMPEKDGFETILEIRRTTPHTKILAVSGGGDLNPLTCLVMAKTLGANAVLAKPVRVETLVSAVRQLLEQPEEWDRDGEAPTM